ncbi:MAG: sensor histidine kinase [Pseudobdellovibrio sp.]
MENELSKLDIHSSLKLTFDKPVNSFTCENYFIYSYIKIPLVFAAKNLATINGQVFHRSIYTTIFYILIFIFCSLIYLLYLEKIILNKIEQKIINPVISLSKDEYLTESENNLNEFNIIFENIKTLKSNIVKQEQIKHDLEKAHALHSISRKIAHDIRSPISTLNMLTPLIKDEEVKKLQTQVVRRIDSIANELLETSKHENTLSKREDIYNIYSVLEKEFSIKSYNADICKILFSFNIKIGAFFINNECSNVLYRNLNNFINNAIEATPRTGSVHINFTDNHDLILIEIIDTGMGIHPDILKKLGTEIISTKNHFLTHNHQVPVSGNGIGVYNAKRDFESLGWSLNITSILNEGSHFSITIPKEKTN